MIKHQESASEIVGSQGPDAVIRKGSEEQGLTWHVPIPGGRGHHPEDQATAVFRSSGPRPTAPGEEGTEGLPALW